MLVVGESLIDIVTDAGPRTTEVAGDSPANVALGLARQQVPVRLLTALGRDARGERIGAHLRAAGVEILDSSWSLSTTSTAHARIRGDGSAEYVFDLDWTLPQTDRLEPADLVHIGSVGAFLEPGATTLERWLERRDESTLVTFDPNIRPALLADREASVAGFERLAAVSDVVKLSDEDAQWLYPSLPLDRVAERVRRCGPRLVATTRGGAGALLHAAGVSVQQGAPSVAVRDTVGAGDTFMTALIQRVRATPRILDAPERSAIAEAGAYAVAAAALTVQRVGADLPTAAQIVAAME